MSTHRVYHDEATGLKFDIWEDGDCRMWMMKRSDLTKGYASASDSPVNAFVQMWQAMQNEADEREPRPILN